MSSINCKLHLVTGFFGGLADDLIVEAIGKCESNDLNPKFAFQGLLAAINFIMLTSAFGNKLVHILQRRNLGIFVFP